jgi:hypothetical protein
LLRCHTLIEPLDFIIVRFPGVHWIVDLGKSDVMVVMFDIVQDPLLFFMCIVTAGMAKSL